MCEDVLFNTKEFLLDISFFTDEQVGQYIKLLCQQHQKGPIPAEHMAKIQGPVANMFKSDIDGNFYNQRMKEASEKRKAYRESRKNCRTGKKEKAFVKPSLGDLVGYFATKGSPDGREAEKFYDFYESKGWMVGKNKMKSWKSSVNNWIRRSNENGNRGSSQQITSESGKYGNIDTV